MKAEEAVLNDCRDWEEVEQMCEAVPDIGVPVFTAAFIVKAVYLGNLPGLVVSS